MCSQLPEWDSYIVLYDLIGEEKYVIVLLITNRSSPPCFANFNSRDFASGGECCLLKWLSLLSMLRPSHLLSHFERLWLFLERL